MAVDMEREELEVLRRAAEAVRDACLRAAVDGYERAGLSGLCEAGRWELAMDAIQSLDAGAIAREVLNKQETRSGSNPVKHQ